MHFKLLVAIVDDALTKDVVRSARDAGASGATVLAQARGEGWQRRKSFLGINLESSRDVLLFVVEEHLCRKVLEAVAEAGHFDDKAGAGIALQLDVEDAVGLQHQIEALTERVEDTL